MIRLVNILAGAAVLLHSCLAADADSCTAKRPNIVFIFTDDQDLHLGSLDYMKSVQNELMAKGTSFSNHFATVSQCCPSRASLFRGQHAHNTNITFVSGPGYENTPKILASCILHSVNLQLTLNTVAIMPNGSLLVKTTTTCLCG